MSHPQPPPPTPGRSGRSGRRIVVAVLALVLLAGLGLAVVTVVTSTGGEGGPELPDEVNGLVATDSENAFDEDDDAEERGRRIDQQRQVQDYNSAEFSEAFDGADVTTRLYRSQDDEEDLRFVQVVAIADEAGPLLPEGYFDDPEVSGTAVPFLERVTEDDVECLVRRTNPPRADPEESDESEEDSDDDDTAPSSVLCQRTSGSLTVRVGGLDDVEDTVEFLDAVWSELD